MHYPKYDVQASTQADYYEFISEGNNGEIRKVIEFSQISINDYNLYNLGFGDKIERIAENGNIIIEYDDSTKSKNGDRDKVLATVASVVYDYTSSCPDRLIFFKGSCEARTRLYRSAISKNYTELSEQFHILGIIVGSDGKNTTIPFNNYTKFEAFIIKRK